MHSERSPEASRTLIEDAEPWLVGTAVSEQQEICLQIPEASPKAEQAGLFCDCSGLTQKLFGGAARSGGKGAQQLRWSIWVCQQQMRVLLGASLASQEAFKQPGQLLLGML